MHHTESIVSFFNLMGVIMFKSCVLFLCFIFLVQANFADEASNKIEPVLAAKEEILEKLKKLKANEGSLLPAPTIMEELGDFAKGWHRMKEFGPNGRDFSIKMVWMSDRERAFFCGANHGSPHRMNDAWEYDLASNTWVLLYVPDYNDAGKITDYDKETLVLEDNFLRTKKGGTAHPAHTWWGLTYDPIAKVAVWYCAWPSYRLQAKLDAIGANKEDLYKGPPMWLFKPQTRKWEPMKTEKPWPAVGIFGGSLEYVEDLKKPVLQYGTTSAVLDMTSKTWKVTSEKGPSLPIETLVYFDTKRKIFVAHRGNQPNPKDTEAGKPEPKKTTWVAKLEGETINPWEVVLETLDAPVGHDARSMMYYDPKSGDGLCFDNTDKTIWSFNPEAKKWTKQTPTGDLPTIDKSRIISYFDIARNVYVVIGSGWVWCYRYKE